MTDFRCSVVTLQKKLSGGAKISFFLQWLKKTVRKYLSTLNLLENLYLRIVQDLEINGSYPGDLRKYRDLKLLEKIKTLSMKFTPEEIENSLKRLVELKKEADGLPCSTAALRNISVLADMDPQVLTRNSRILEPVIEAEMVQGADKDLLYDKLKRSLKSDPDLYKSAVRLLENQHVQGIAPEFFNYISGDMKKERKKMFLYIGTGILAVLLVTAAIMLTRGA